MQQRYHTSPVINNQKVEFSFLKRYAKFHLILPIVLGIVSFADQRLYSS